MKNEIEEKINSPEFVAALSALESVGPIVLGNPRMDKAYKTLRLLGLSKEETVEMLNKEVNRRLSNL